MEGDSARVLTRKYRIIGIAPDCRSGDFGYWRFESFYFHNLLPCRITAITSDFDSEYLRSNRSMASNGDCSLIGRAHDCGSCMWRFDPVLSPQCPRSIIGSASGYEPELCYRSNRYEGTKMPKWWNGWDTLVLGTSTISSHCGFDSHLRYKSSSGETVRHVRLKTWYPMWWTL